MEDPLVIRKAIGRRIAVLREEADLSQETLAERAEFGNVTNYRRIEHGQQNLTISTTIRVANAIGCKVSEFFIEGQTGSAKTK